MPKVVVYYFSVNVLMCVHDSYEIVESCELYDLGPLVGEIPCMPREELELDSFW